MEVLAGISFLLAEAKMDTNKRKCFLKILKAIGYKFNTRRLIAFPKMEKTQLEKKWIKDPICYLKDYILRDKTKKCAGPTWSQLEDIEDDLGLIFHSQLSCHFTGNTAPIPPAQAIPNHFGEGHHMTMYLFPKASVSWFHVQLFG